MKTAIAKAVLRRSTVSLSWAALVLLVAVTTGSLLGAPPALRRVVGTGLDAVVRRHDLLSLLTGAVFAPNLGALLLAIAAIVVVTGGAERLLGHARTLLVGVASTVLGIATGIVLQAGGVLVRGVWSQAPFDTLVVDPLIPVAGTAMAASAFAGPLWRRRIRVLGFTALVVVLLYSGEPGDAYRLTAGGVGLVLGMLLARRRPRLRWRRSSHHETRSLLAAVVGVTALGPVVALVAPHGYGPLRPLGLLFRDPLPPGGFLRDPCDALRGSAACARQIALAHVNGPGAAVMPVLVLGALLAGAWGMWFGRRAGAVIVVLLNAMVALLTTVFFGILPALRHPATLLGPALNGGPTLQTTLAALVPAVVAVLVLVNIRHFDVRPRRSVTIASIVAVTVAFVAGALSYALVGMLLPGQFSPRSDPLTILGDLPQRYVPIGFLHLRHPLVIPIGQPAHFIHDWMGPLLWVVVLGAAVVLRFDTVVPVGADDQQLRRLLRIGGAGSISYMATWPGNLVRFSSSREHAVAYREISGVALVLGEPIGSAAGRLAAAREFAVACDDKGLTPVFYAVSPAFARSLSDERRWSVTTIGEDTIIRVHGFTMTGKRWQDVRTSINRAKRNGVTTTWTGWNDCTVSQRAQITAISEEWVADRGLPELGFTLGGIDELRDPGVRLMLALDADGHVLAATSWLPTWRDDVLIGWTLDFMRRSADTMNGLMEFLIAEVLLRAAADGIEFVSLSASPLALSEVEDNGPLEPLLRVLSRALEPAYGFASLASFKAKFQPDLAPLALAYPDSLALPATGLALTRAYLPHLTARAALRLVSAFR